MPRPQSDSYDSEFGTASNAEAMREAIGEIAERVRHYTGAPGPEDAVALALSKNGPRIHVAFSDRELRLIRLGLLRAMETL